MSRRGSATDDPETELLYFYNIYESEWDAEQEDVFRVSLLELREFWLSMEEVDLVAEHQDGDAD